MQSTTADQRLDRSRDVCTAPSYAQNRDEIGVPRATANGPYTQTPTFAFGPGTQRLTSATNPENDTVSYI
jgi:hypothetical protein